MDVYILSRFYCLFSISLFLCSSFLQPIQTATPWCSIASERDFLPCLSGFIPRPGTVGYPWELNCSDVQVINKYLIVSIEINNSQIQRQWIALRLQFLNVQKGHSGCMSHCQSDSLILNPSNAHSLLVILLVSSKKRSTGVRYPQ